MGDTIVNDIDPPKLLSRFTPLTLAAPFCGAPFQTIERAWCWFSVPPWLVGALGTCHICCIRRGQSSLGVSALLLCRRGCGAREVVQQWHFFLLAPFCNLRGFVKHDNILRNMNFGNHLNETNVAISLRVGVANHLKLVRIYLRNPVITQLGTTLESVSN